MNSITSDILSDMTISIRELVRDFPKVKAAVRKGKVIEIRDGKTGEVFVLTLKREQKQTFGELAASAKAVYAGPKDLSSREGFDASAHR